MYLLILSDENRDTQWLCFESEEEGREFLSLVPGFHGSNSEDSDDGSNDWIEVSEVPDYTEIHFKGNVIPFSRFMFSGCDRVEVFFTIIPSPSRPNQGVLDGVSLVDAYLIPNDEMSDYISSRERNFGLVQMLLEEQGYEVDRGYQGSEDGEAIIYRHKGEVEWHFLGHMDPSFVELGKEGEEAVQEWVRYNLS